jgi:hypothetical protein
MYMSGDYIFHEHIQALSHKKIVVTARPNIHAQRKPLERDHSHRPEILLHPVGMHESMHLVCLLLNACGVISRK